MEAFKGYLMTLPSVFPCSYCRSSLRSYLPPRMRELRDPDQVLDFVHSLHEMVNSKLRKPELSMLKFLYRVEGWTRFSSSSAIMDWIAYVMLQLLFPDSDVRFDDVMKNIFHLLEFARDYGYQGGPERDAALAFLEEVESMHDERRLSALEFISRLLKLFNWQTDAASQLHRYSETMVKRPSSSLLYSPGKVGSPSRRHSSRSGPTH